MNLKAGFIALPFAASLLLAGCGDEDEVKEAPNAENENQAEMDPENGTDKNEKLDVTFKSFELEVDYKGENNDYEADYDGQGANTEASIEDQVNDHEVHGDEAMEELLPMFEKLSFTEDSEEDQVIQDVISAFKVKDDYEEFNLEVTFNDGKTKEYKDVK